MERLPLHHESYAQGEAHARRTMFTDKEREVINNALDHYYDYLCEDWELLEDAQKDGKFAAIDSASEKVNDRYA